MTPREQELEALPDPIRCLRLAMDDAAIPTEFRAELIGYFCNAWNAALAKPIAHTDHPMRHWDRTCPACLVEQQDDWQRGMEQAAKIVEITAWKMGIRMTDSDPLASAIRAAASEQEEK